MRWGCCRARVMRSNRSLRESRPRQNALGFFRSHGTSLFDWTDSMSRVTLETKPQMVHKGVIIRLQSESECAEIKPEGPRVNDSLRSNKNFKAALVCISHAHSDNQSDNQSGHNMGIHEEIYNRHDAEWEIFLPEHSPTHLTEHYIRIQLQSIDQ